MNRTLLLLAAGFVAGLALASCSPTAGTCSKATCGGCCDDTGKCQSGTSNSTCGVDGATCGRCGTGTVCQLGECTIGNQFGGGTGGGTTGGGTGGGTTGGGTGGGTTGGGTTGGGTGGGTTGGGTGGGTTGGGTGGGSSGCLAVGTLAPTLQNSLVAEYRAFRNGNGHYNFALWGFLPTAGGLYDTLRLEVVYPNDVFNLSPPPVTAPFTSVGYRACDICAVYSTGCGNDGVCAKEYLAQGGSVTITRADRAAAGHMTGSAQSVRFNLWDLNNDLPLNSGDCIEVTAVNSFDVGWNNDGGVIP